MIMDFCEQQKIIFPDEVIPRKGQRITLKLGDNHYQFLVIEILSIDWVRHTEKGIGLLVKMEGVLGDRVQ